MTLNNAWLSVYWQVDRIQAYLAGQLFRDVPFPFQVFPLTLPIGWAVWVEVLFVSICHNTNWDRLHARFLDIADKEPEQLSPPAVSALTREGFLNLFGDVIGGEQQKRGERAGILRQVADVAGDVLTDASNSVPFFRPGKARLGGESGIYNWLARIPAFGGDPLQKKSRILIHQLLAYRLLEIADPENILPAVDYHLMRLYVRTGRVVARRAETVERLRGHRKVARVEFVTHLRRAVEEAMWYTASGAQRPVNEVNHIEWQIGRSYCTRKEARCDGPYLETKPPDACVRALSPSSRACPLRRDCAGAIDERLRSIVDPASSRSYY